MKYCATWGLLALFLFSCKQDTPHLTQQKMQAILQDIHLAETYSTMLDQDSLHHSNEKKLDSLALYYQLIFEHHKINKKEFDNSLVWYKQNPEKLDSIYTRMLDQVSLLEGKYNIPKTNATPQAPAASSGSPR